MGLLWTVLTVPLAPVRVVLAVSKVIQRQVEEELRHPASARRDLEAIEKEHREGAISDEEQAHLQQRVVDRMAAPVGTGDEREDVRDGHGETAR